MVRIAYKSRLLLHANPLIHRCLAFRESTECVSRSLIPERMGSSLFQRSASVGCFFAVNSPLLLSWSEIETGTLSANSPHCSAALNNTRHASFDARLAQPWHHKWTALLDRCAEDREELQHRSLTECFFHQIDSHAPPSEDRADDPEVSGGLHSGLHSNAASEQAAGYCRSNCQSGEDAT